jgi:serine/threonine protein kinase
VQDVGSRLVHEPNVALIPRAAPEVIRSAKLSTPAALVGAEEATQTIAEAHLVTEDGIIIGSIPYMSPEQAEGKPVDARSDIFSFGAVLYEMITGKRAFQGASRISTLAAVVEKDPQPPSQISSGTPPELERLIGRCLRKDVNRRSQNMSNVKLDGAARPHLHDAIRADDRGGDRAADWLRERRRAPGASGGAAEGDRGTAGVGRGARTAPFAERDFDHHFSAMRVALRTAHWRFFRPD